jgi:hypothetical protein
MREFFATIYGKALGMIAVAASLLALGGEAVILYKNYNDSITSAEQARQAARVQKAEADAKEAEAERIRQEAAIKLEEARQAARLKKAQADAAEAEARIKSADADAAKTLYGQKSGRTNEQSGRTTEQQADDIAAGILGAPYGKSRR